MKLQLLLIKIIIHIFHNLFNYNDYFLISRKVFVNLFKKSNLINILQIVQFFLLCTNPSVQTCLCSQPFVLACVIIFIVHQAVLTCPILFVIYLAFLELRHPCCSSFSIPSPPCYFFPLNIAFHTILFQYTQPSMLLFFQLTQSSMPILFQFT